MQLISNTLKNLTIQGPEGFLNLTLFPLLGESGHKRDYVTLREAIGTGAASLREVSTSGSVPDLVLENRGTRPVLVLEGEELIGAKQNRSANLTILAPAGKTTNVSVACVEAGRWGYTSREFSSSEQMHYAAGRRDKLSSVLCSMSDGAGPTADQGKVWRDIAMKSRSLRVSSPTAAMSDIYLQHRASIEDYVGAFEPRASQVGAVFAIDARIEGLELFDSRDTLAEMLPKLIRSYALDAIEVTADDDARPKVDDARAFLTQVARCEARPHDSIGVGTNLRLQGDGVIASGLVTDERVVHLAAFAVPEESQSKERASRGLARLWRRRML